MTTMGSLKLCGVQLPASDVLPGMFVSNPAVSLWSRVGASGACLRLLWGDFDFDLFHTGKFHRFPISLM